MPSVIISSNSEEEECVEEEEDYSLLLPDPFDSINVFPQINQQQIEQQENDFAIAEALQQEISKDLPEAAVSETPTLAQDWHTLTTLSGNSSPVNLGKQEESEDEEMEIENKELSSVKSIAHDSMLGMSLQTPLLPPSSCMIVYSSDKDKQYAKKLEQLIMEQVFSEIQVKISHEKDTDKAIKAAKENGITYAFVVDFYEWSINEVEFELLQSQVDREGNCNFINSCFVSKIFYIQQKLLKNFFAPIHTALTKQLRG